MTTNLQTKNRRRRTMAAGIAAVTTATVFAAIVPTANADAPRAPTRPALQAILDRAVGPRHRLPGRHAPCPQPRDGTWSGAAGQARVRRRRCGPETASAPAAS